MSLTLLYCQSMEILLMSKCFWCKKTKKKMLNCFFYSHRMHCLLNYKFRYNFNSEKKNLILANIKYLPFSRLMPMYMMNISWHKVVLLVHLNKRRCLFCFYLRCSVQILMLRNSNPHNFLHTAVVHSLIHYNTHTQYNLHDRFNELVHGTCLVLCHFLHYNIVI